ncbi:MAG: hypothetical protein ACREEE_10640 [Dongiaceae bacterium]
MKAADDTALAIACPACGAEARLTPRQLRASLAAQCRQCKHSLVDAADAALRAYQTAKGEPVSG